MLTCTYLLLIWGKLPLKTSFLHLFFAVLNLTLTGGNFRNCYESKEALTFSLQTRCKIFPPWMSRQRITATPWQESFLQASVLLRVGVPRFVYGALLHNRRFRSDAPERRTPFCIWLSITLAPVTHPSPPEMRLQRVTKHGSPMETETLDWSALSH